MTFSLAWKFNGIVPYLWDTSNKKYGDMKYYDRENNIWYDKKIKNFLSQISKEKFFSIWDHFIYTNAQNSTEDINEDYELEIDDLTMTKICFSINFNENFT